MALLRIHRSICLFSLICIFSNFAEAKDISTLQTALTLAREDMERAKDKHEASTRSVIQQQRIVADRKKQLADESRQLDKMQKDTKLAWEQYIAAKQKYEKARSTLNAAWGKN